MRKQELPSTFFIGNRKKLIEKLPSFSLVVFFSNSVLYRNSDQQYAYRQSSDMLYFTGINQAETVLVLIKNEQKTQEVLFIQKPDDKTAIWDGHQFSLEEAAKKSGVEKVNYIDDLKSMLEKLAPNCKKLLISYPKHHIVAKKWVSFLLEKNPALKTEELKPYVAQLRVIKQPEEIALIKTAIRITENAFYQLLTQVRPEQIEYQIEAEIIHSFISQGASGHAFHPIIASGDNNCVLHYIANNRRMKNGELLLLDFGAEYNGYAADMSRTIPVNRKYSSRQRDVYNAVLDVQNKAIQLIRPGVSIQEINEKVRPMMEEKMIELSLFTKAEIDAQDPENPVSKKYFMHGTSHYLGLDVHDVGDITAPLQPGMIITCEPGLYITEEKLGVRIENDILVTQDGNIDLLSHIPREINEIEKLME